MNPGVLKVFGLEGRVALVTGASGGIGRALSLGLGGAGAQLALTGRSVERLAESAKIVSAAGCEHTKTFPGIDLADPDQAQDLVAAVIERMGRIDILVNIAGINRRRASLDITEDDWDAISSSNLKSVFFLSREVARTWIDSGRASKKDGKGKIVSIASLAGTIGIPEIAPYGASKLGIVALTRSLGVEWAELGICVNAIAPGYLETPLTIAQGIFENPVIGPWVRSRIPMGRLGTPEDLVGAAVFLASPASDYVTGQTLFVDGGFEAG